MAITVEDVIGPTDPEDDSAHVIPRDVATDVEAFRGLVGLEVMQAIIDHVVHDILHDDEHTHGARPGSPAEEHST